MKPKLIALNLLLLAAIAAVAWQIRVRSEEWNRTRQANLNVPIKPAPAPPLAPAPKPDTPPPAKYLDVAEKDLFSKDRNPTVVVEPPKIEPPKPMPPLPVVYGVMGLPSGAKAIMAEKPGAGTKAVRTGDTIGEFKVLQLDTQNVTFLWDGKQITKKIEDLVDRSASLSASAGQGGAPAGPAAPAPSGPAAPAPAQPQRTNNNPTSSDLGITLTETQRACKPNDGIPAGAVVDGYKKVVTASPFGAICRWNKQ